MGRSKTLFLTGGTGYLGKILLPRLKRLSTNGDDLEVVALSRDPEKFKQGYPELLFPRLRFVRGEIENFSLPEDIDFDWILHGATPSDAPRNEEEARSTWASSFEGTRHLSREIARRVSHGMPAPRHILYLSSGAVYSMPSTAVKIDERADLVALRNEPQAESGKAYGDAKRAAEDRLIRFSAESGVPVSIARIFAVAGPYVPFEGRFALGQFISSALKSRKISIAGDGTAVRSFLSGEDLSDWLLSLLFAPEKHGIYNVGSESELTIREVAESIKGAFSEEGIDVQIEIQGKASSGGAGHRYVPSVSKIKAAFGLSPRKDSREAIREAVKWVLANHSDAH